MPLIDPDSIQRKINVARTACFFCSAFAIYKGIETGFGIWTITFIIAFALCGIGLQQKSRISAIIALVISTLFSIALLNFAHPALALLFFLTLMYYTIQGIRGTFAYHKDINLSKTTKE